jgi:hypothetical protein
LPQPLQSADSLRSCFHTQCSFDKTEIFTREHNLLFDALMNHRHGSNPKPRGTQDRQEGTRISRRGGERLKLCLPILTRSCQLPIAKKKKKASEASLCAIPAPLVPWVEVSNWDGPNLPK